MSSDAQREVRVVNAVTGGEKGSKLQRFGLIPVKPLRMLAEHYGKGARKYADRNWERGYEWHLSFEAMERHAWAFWGGQDFDDHEPTCAPECVEHTGSHHLVAVAWHAFALLEFCFTHRELDNRPSSVKN
jgi:hypothetical protein